MAGFMDMLGKRPEGESVSSYQKTVMKEIARKLTELEEQNDQNAAAIDEIKRLQKLILQKMDTMNVGAAPDAAGSQSTGNYAGYSEVEALQRQVSDLILQLKESVTGLGDRLQENDQSLESKLQNVLDLMNEEEADDSAAMEERLLDKMDTMKLSIEDTVHKENIKCYRNVQGAIEEQGDVKEYDVKGLKKYLKVVVWFQLITIVLLVLRILGLL